MKVLLVQSVKMSFNSVPSEIIIKIALFLPKKRLSLLNFSLSCKDVYSLLLPLLFKTINLNALSSSPKKININSQFVANLQMFTRNLTANCNDSNNTPSTELEIFLSQNLLSLNVDFGRRDIPPSFVDQFKCSQLKSFDCRMEANSNNLMSLSKILIKLESLKSLALNFPELNSPYADERDESIDHFAFSLTNLKSLQKIRISNFYLVCRIIPALNKIPKIQEMRLDNCEFHLPATSTPLAHFISSSQLRKLQITKSISRIWNSSLISALKSCQTIEKLTIDVDSESAIEAIHFFNTLIPGTLPKSFSISLDASKFKPQMVEFPVNVAGVESLSISCVNDRVGLLPHILNGLHACDTLRELKIAHTNENAIRSLIELLKSDTLYELSFGLPSYLEMQMKSETYKSLTNVLKKSRNLKVLQMGNFGVEHDELLVEMLQGNSSIVELELEYFMNVYPDIYMIISGVKKNRDLKLNRIRFLDTHLNGNHGEKGFALLEFKRYRYPKLSVYGDYIGGVVPFMLDKWDCSDFMIEKIFLSEVSDGSLQTLLDFANLSMKSVRLAMKDGESYIICREREIYCEIA
ncbi:hypothetical protein HK098_000342 [Nowakowskiella sp. JEL0407]|nr:hypothetical protein HK098_000342 [Nowakowskiella sp. JEL0407]